MFLIQCMGSSHSRRLVEYLGKSDKGLKCIASLSISGVRICELKKRFKIEHVEFTADVPLVVFVGGNDILNGVAVEIVKGQYLSLVRLIRRKLPNITLFLICLPIFPRSTNKPTEVESLQNFNLFLNSLSNDRTFTIALKLYVRSPDNFHRFYSRSNRPDLLHLNARGYEVLVGLLLPHYKNKSVICPPVKQHDLLPAG